MSKVSMDLKTEKRLIRTAQKGGRRGREAVAKIYQHYAPHLENFFRARLGSNPIVEDLVSETFKKALSGIDSFRWQSVSLSAWLYKISQNILIDYFRESSKRKSLHLEDIAPPKTNEPGPAAVYIQTERASLLHTLLDELPKRERTIVYLKFFEGQTNKAIAQKLTLSETNIGTIVHRTLAKLRTKIPNTTP